MLINKNIVLDINITDPRKIFATRTENVIMNELTDRFTGKCINGVYIRKILEVKHHGPIRFNSQYLGEVATVSVEFTASTEVYEKGDVILCKIKMISPAQDYALESDHAAVYMTNPRIPGAQIGDVIPVYVSSCTYTLMQPITAIAIPFVPIFTDQVFELPDEPGTPDLALYSLIAETETRFRALQKDNPAMMTKLESLVHPHRSRKPVSGTKSFAEIGDIKGRFVSRPATLFGRPELLVVTPGSGVSVIPVAKSVAYSHMMRGYIRELNILITLGSGLTSEKIGELKYVWDLYEKYKRA